MPGMSDSDLFDAPPVTALPAPAPAPVAQTLFVARRQVVGRELWHGGEQPVEPAPTPPGLVARSGQRQWRLCSVHRSGVGVDNAADTNLQAKVSKHGLTTVAGIIAIRRMVRAPASDNNDPAAYAAKVAAGLGIKPTDDISQRLLTDPTFRHTLEQMAAVETGAPQKFGGGAGILTNDEAAQWAALAGPQKGTYPSGATAPDLESDAMKVLTLAQVRDEGQPKRSIIIRKVRFPAKVPLRTRISGT